MDELITVTIKGRKQKITHRRFVYEALLKAAANGNVSAAKELLDLQAKNQDDASQIPAVQPLSAEEEEIFKRFLEQEAKRQATAKQAKS